MGTDGLAMMQGDCNGQVTVMALATYIGHNSLSRSSSEIDHAA